MVTFALVSVTPEVESFEMHCEILSEALPGNSVGFSVKDVPVRDVYHGSSGYPELSGPNQGWLCISAGLSHSSHAYNMFAELEDKINYHPGEKLEDGPKLLKLLILFLANPVCQELL